MADGPSAPPADRTLEGDAVTGMIQIPLDAFFQVRLALPRLRPLPPLDGSLQGWPAAARLPDLSSLHFQSAFGQVYVGWTLDGIAFAVAVATSHPLRLDREHPFRSDGLEIWIDTRDSRTARKPTRFCHHFLVLPGASGTRGAPPHVQEMNPGGVRRAEEMADLSRVHLAARIPGLPAQGSKGYSLEGFLPREVLTGYAPPESTSIALGYRLRSSIDGVQDLAFGTAFPLWRNPSLWLSAALVGA